MKITHQFGLQGWIETVGSNGGGLRLARRPEYINLGALVRGVEPDFQLVECFATSSSCTLTGHCGLTGVLESALQRLLTYLDGFTLADALKVTAVAEGDWQRLAWHPRALS